MSDEGEITKLQEEYALRFDARDADGFAALFVEDAEVVLPGGFRLLGNEKLHKAVRNMPPGGRHFPEPGKIELDGDTATSSSRFRFAPTDGEEITGHYEDRFVRTARGWRFSYRRSVQDAASA
ncbi:MAG: hypothetical protein JWO52_3625 [Gammaproteobacteria bacterium]|jgi:uncharacterized protein (TIGR02246 family)|nr:hypothetical protein [Gammaproteobacteria bacterium]